MASLYLSAIGEGGRTIVLKPLTNRAAQFLDPPLADTSGYFLVEENGHETAVLARVETEDAALRLAKLLGLV
ncbi:hypothetical protein [Altericroceibacterium xinjiangense]|uniref:hypothetical protein n=1 Tax=Altericroceibacterium xinjiangense TaxID=762261 RepID=UPI000F7F7410|nr:hypothetical protein [Altericroceibacterium xinjiangense]